MKQIALLILLVSTFAWADDPAPPPPPLRRMITVDVGDLVYEGIISNGATDPITAAYETDIADHLSLVFAPNVTINRNAAVGLGFGLGANIFPFSVGIGGLYLGPEVSLLTGSASSNGAT